MISIFARANLSIVTQQSACTTAPVPNDANAEKRAQ